ncbi:hypothetical protein ScPMuIL_001749 [Solemya velum]
MVQAQSLSFDLAVWQSAMDDSEIKLLRKYYPELVKRVDPVAMLPYLPCLRQESVEKIQACQTNHGPRRAVQELYSQLIRSENSYDQLIKALNHPEIGLYELAKLLTEPTKQGNSGRRNIEQNISTNAGWKEQHATNEKRENLAEGVERQITGETLYRDLPSTVQKPLRRLDCLTGLTNWKDLASALGYSVDEVSQLQVQGDHAQSHTITMLEDWKGRPNSTLYQLIRALKKMEREDILNEIVNLTEWLHQEIVLEADALDITKDSSNQNSNLSSHEQPGNDKSPMTKREKVVNTHQTLPRTENHPGTFRNEELTGNQFSPSDKPSHLQDTKRKMELRENSIERENIAKPMTSLLPTLPVKEGNSQLSEISCKSIETLQQKPMNDKVQLKFCDYDSTSISVKNSKRQEKKNLPRIKEDVVEGNNRNHNSQLPVPLPVPGQEGKERGVINPSSSLVGTCSQPYPK